MPKKNRFKVWKFTKNRTEAFSDGVFAIIITLLILEIKIPHLNNPTSNAELVKGLIDLLPKIVSWVVSFFFISVMWVQHHNLFRMVTKIDYAIVWVNNILLLFICFLPFPTALMGEYPNIRLAVLLFGAIISIVSLIQVWLYHYVVENYLRPEFDKAKSRRNVKLSFILAPFLLIIATCLSFVHIWLTYFFYAMVPLVFILPFDKENHEILDD